MRVVEVKNLNGTFTVTIEGGQFVTIRKPDATIAEIAAMAEACTNMYELRALAASAR